MTDTLIKEKGMKILIEQLGYVEAERFIMLMNREPFDYTGWREENLEEPSSVRELSRMAMGYCD
ncbi:MAG TPA: hypothetical protein GXX75_09850 [Clostridiales bacterium]|nr:hypothetical protein [Clostridiales bacterium]